jgi:N-acetyl-anhydromuramyl-L-alanine amidase AmpD
MTYPIYKAKYYGGPLTRVDLIVLHSAETGERTGSAESIARWFASPYEPKSETWYKVSAHFCVDCDSIVQCVPENMMAYHARGVNDRSIGIEMAGRARQTRAEWMDPYGLLMLGYVHKLVGDLCDRHQIRRMFVDRDGIRAGVRGVTTHREVTMAYHIKGGHTDPGLDFPMDLLMSMRSTD